MIDLNEKHFQRLLCRFVEYYKPTASTLSCGIPRWGGERISPVPTSPKTPGRSASFNGDDGIVAVSGSSVQRNTVRSNGGYGLNLGSDAAYRENVITGTVTATTGTVLGGVDAGGNVCNGSLTCP